jgi:hypothetical protein
MSRLSMPTNRTAMDLGGRPRVTDYGNFVQGVAAQTPTMASSVPRGRLPTTAPVGLGAALARQARGLTTDARLGGGVRPSAVRPQKRMGPIPKLSTGSGQTAAQAARALGYTPGGYTPPRQIKAAGMDMMPYLQEDTHSTGTPGKDKNRAGFPPHGVAATSGWEMQATYHPHDYSWWVSRFATQGRSPGVWQQTSFGPSYRALQRHNNPNGYNVYNGIALGRPLSQRAYMLPWMTPANVAAQIGGGVGRPLGY